MIMGNLGLTYRAFNQSSGIKYYSILPQQVVIQTKTDAVDSAVRKLLLTTQGQKIAARFLNKPAGWWKTILYSKYLTPYQKFQEIFGVAADTLKPAVQLLGDIFEWIGNLFSEKNLNEAEKFLNKVYTQSQNVQSLIEQIKSGKIQSQYQQASQIMEDYSTVKSFWDEYKILVIAGAAGLLIYFLTKKK
jgi:hypothetical protein